MNCSYACSPGLDRHSLGPGPFRARTFGQPNSHASPIQTPASALASVSSGSQPRYRLVGPKAGNDIGSGTPAEILREGELVHELVLLYFNNFGDVHFMFDKDSFLRQLAMGEASKMILYAMMALGIKQVTLPQIL